MITIKWVIKGQEYYETFSDSEDSSNFVRRLLRSTLVSYVESLDQISGLYIKHLVAGSLTCGK